MLAVTAIVGHCVGLQEMPLLAAVGACARSRHRAAIGATMKSVSRRQSAHLRPNHQEVAMNPLRVSHPFDIDMFDDAFRGFLRPWKFEPVSQAPTIKLDLTEHDDSYAVKAEIPGVRKEDIDLRIEGNLVTISAEVKKDKEESKDGRVLRAEREYGYASRSFTLASAVDDSKADAKYSNGVLELVLPKKAASGTRKLTIG
jgi:HSP20 family protein